MLHDFAHLPIRRQDVIVSNPLDKPLINVSVKLKLFDEHFIEKGFDSVKDEALFPLSFNGLKPEEYAVKALFEYVFENNLTIYIKGSEVKYVERGFKSKELFSV